MRKKANLATTVRAALAVVVGMSVLQPFQIINAEDGNQESSGATLLKEKKYRELNNLLLVKQRKYEAGTLTPREVYQAFNFVSGKDLQQEANLNEWVKNVPESYPANYARGLYYIRRGWRVRGADYINKTSPEHIREMSRLMNIGATDLRKSLAMADKPLISYLSLINAGMAMGWKEQNRSWIEAANRIDPDSTFVKVEYLLTLRPRWGGSIEEMQAFVDESRNLLKRQEDINMLQSHVWRSQAFVRREEFKDYQGCVEYYSKAIESYDKDTSPFVSRGNCYSFLKKYDEAMRDFNYAISKSPKYQYAYVNRGYTLREMKRYDEAIENLVHATELNPDDGYAWTTLGYTYFLKNQHGKAFASYQKGATLGDANSQQGLGFLYWVGKGTRPDRDQAIHWWKIAAQNGNAQAIHDLRVEGILP